MMNPLLVQGNSVSDSSGYTPGMNDEEELRRMGTAYAGEGIGEVFAELDDFDELGLRAE
jgi:hypothetical protein